jgi:hypothetical protein
MPRKQLVLAIVFSATTLLLSGCATGFNAATNTQRDSGNGRSIDVGSLQIRNATIVVDLADPTRATVLMTIINNDDAVAEILTGVEVANNVRVEEYLLIALPAKKVLNIGFDSEYRIVLTSAAGFVPGQFIDVSLILKSGQSVPLSILINEKTGIYADIEIPARAAQPAPEPTPSAS